MAASPFVGEIFMFAGNFAMTGTATCDGQLLPISSYTALFSLLGTNYGGDGRSTFALPNLQGAAPVGHGQSTSGTEYFIGQSAGVAAVTLITSELPAHTHQTLQVAMNTGTTPLTATAVGSLPATTTTDLYASTEGPNFMTPLNVALNPNTDPAGGGLPHNNRQPYLAVTFVIALQGIFPQRS